MRSTHDLAESRPRRRTRALIAAICLATVVGLAALFPLVQVITPGVHDPVGARVKECTPGTARRHLMVCQYPDGTLRAFDASVEPPRPISLPEQDMRRIVAADPSY